MLCGNSGVAAGEGCALQQRLHPNPGGPLSPAKETITRARASTSSSSSWGERFRSRGVRNHPIPAVPDRVVAGVLVSLGVDQVPDRGSSGAIGEHLVDVGVGESAGAFGLVLGVGDVGRLPRNDTRSGLIETCSSMSRWLLY